MSPLGSLKKFWSYLLWIEVIFFRGANPPPQGCPLVAKKSLGKYPSTSSLWFQPILSDFFDFSFFSNGFKNGNFYMFQAPPHHRFGCATIFYFLFQLLPSQGTFSASFSPQLEKFLNGRYISRSAVLDSIFRVVRRFGRATNFFFCNHLLPSQGTFPASFRAQLENFLNLHFWALHFS